MGTLARLQKRFLAAVVDAREDGAVRDIRAGRIAAAQSLAIYRANLLANWRAALADTFPVVERLVGEAFFGEAARRYAGEHRSASGDLHAFGRHFPVFLDAYPYARELPWLGDIARLEWAWHEAFHAADAPGLDFAALARVPEEDQGRVRFELHPSVRLVESRYPVLAIWEANQPGRDGTPDRLEGAEAVLVHRPGADVVLRRLEGADALLVRAVQRGEALEAAAQSAGQADPEGFSRCLRELVAARAIAAFAVP